MHDPDPLLTTRTSRVRRRSPFTIIGMIVVAIVIGVVAYFAWVGWKAKGQPTPDVTVTTRPVSLQWHPAPSVERVRDGLSAA